MEKTLMTNQFRKMHLFSHIQKVDGKTKVMLLNGPTRRTLIAEGRFVPNVGLTDIVIYTDKLYCNDIYLLLQEAMEENKSTLLSMCFDARSDVDAKWPLKKFYYSNNKMSLAVQHGTTKEEFFHSCEIAWENFSSR